MKRLHRCLFACLMLIAGNGYAVDIYIAPSGSDNHPGTKEQPLATLAAALRKARELRRLNDPSIASGIHIIVAGGTYTLYEPVFIRPEDAGTSLSKTIIKAAPGERPVFSGGMTISQWYRARQTIPGLPATAQAKVWVADVPMTGANLTEFRQLWVNDRKAIRARDRNGDSMNRILSWDKAEETCWIPTPKTGPLQNAGGLEMFIHQWWEIAVLRIKRLETRGDSTKLFFHQPESKIQSEHPWPAPWISKETGNSAFYLMNAIQLLDEPGEWWLDIANRKLYYWPRPGEDMQHAKVVAPVLETLLRIEGTIDRPVSNIQVEGISFEHTGWLRPSKYGHVPHQAGMYMLDAYKLKQPGTADKKTLENQAWVGRPAAAVELRYANNTIFEACSFRHLAANGLDYGKGTQQHLIGGNFFGDIGGTALLIGLFSEEATEVHIPYNPADERDHCSNIMVVNNLINDAANEDWGAVGIGAGYVRNVLIDHNEICDVSYSGISVGWGWTPTLNAMKDNRITRNKICHYGKHMYDVAGIYTLSAQPGSLIGENYIDSIYKARYAHIPSHWFYLYTDEGSSHFTVRNNWCPSEKFLQNANGPGNSWTNNGPQAGDLVRTQAGLPPAYHYLRNKKKPLDVRPINKEQPVILEMIASEALDIAKLKTVLEQNKVRPGSLYQWNNHYVIFDKVSDVFVLRERLRKAFPSTVVKTYDDLFYEFNRDHCGEKAKTAEWDHVLLTADLVADTKLQKEYMDYHATQFEKWPEVSRGFCNADFQQLLLFRNGRQLMLVISIPKGASLDKLNPKTTENNPGMNEWNALMKKYQQGINGTAPGETWVFLKQLTN